MSILRLSVVAVAVVLWCGSSARAQGVVPGGWAPQVGYQSFGVVSPGGGAVGFGFATPGFGVPGFGMPGFGGGYGPPGYNPYAIAQYSSNFTAVPIGTGPQVVSGMSPLIQGIRQSTRSATTTSRTRRPR